MEEFKTCSMCREPKELSLFNKNKARKDGYNNNCRDCCKAMYQNNKSTILERNKKYAQENIEVIREYQKNYRLSTKDSAKEYRKNYYHENKEHLLKNSKEYNLRNSESVNSWKREYEKHQMLNNPIYFFRKRVRTLIGNSFKRACRGVYKKGNKTEDILGCDLYFFMEYIESLFKPGMSFDNYGDWHIDHKIPLANAKTVEEIVALNNYKNLQPLWAIENLKKGSTYDKIRD
jgi:hypothetical protein